MRDGICFVCIVNIAIQQQEEREEEKNPNEIRN